MLLLLQNYLPTISSVSPSVGLAQGRNLVRLVGTNFSLHGVRVSVRGRTSPRAATISATEVHFLAPRNPQGTWDIVLQNLDADGDDIPGETVTASGLYRYQRPNLDSTHKSSWSRIVEAMVELFKNDLVPNVSFTQSVEFDPENGLHSSIVTIAKYPGMAIFGPTPRPSRINPARAKTTYKDSTTGRVEVRHGLHREDLVFTFVVAEQESNQRQISLMAAFRRWFDTEGYLELNRHPTDSSQGTVEFPFRLEGQMEPFGAPSESNVKLFRGSFSIMGVAVEDAPGFAGSNVDSETGSTTSMTTTTEEL